MHRTDSPQVISARRFVATSHWYFRAYIACVVAAFFGSTLSPATAWIYHDSASIYLLCGFGLAVWLSARGIDRISHDADIGPAAAFAVIHALCSMLLLGAFVCFWLYAFGEPRGMARFGLLAACAVLGGLLCLTCARAVRIAFACSFLSIEVARGYCPSRVDNAGVLDN